MPLSQPLSPERRECQKCGAYKNVLHPFIVGEGSPSPSVLFVGIAPGREEDIRGRVFMGESGQVLREVIDCCTFKDNVYFENLVCCRTHEGGTNRDPSATEISCCIEHLLDTIQTLNPKVVVLLGDLVCKILLKPDMPKVRSMRVSALRGNPIEINGTYLLATYHPAAFLYSDSKVNLLEAYQRDFQLIENLLSGDMTPGVEYRLVLSRKDLLEFQAEAYSADSFSWDMESNQQSNAKERCNIFAPDYKVVTMSFSFEEKSAWCIPFQHKQTPKDLWIDTGDSGRGHQRHILNGLFDILRKSIAHNYIHEYMVLKHIYGIDILQKFIYDKIKPCDIIHDSLLLHYCMDTSKRHGLNGLIREFLPELLNLQQPFFFAYNQIPEEERNYGEVDLEILGQYNNVHADSTNRLSALFLKDLKESGMKWAYENILIPSVFTLGDMSMRGIPFDAEKAIQLQELNRIRLNMLSSALNTHKDIVDTMQRMGRSPSEFNVKSADMVRELVFHQLHLRSLKSTKGGKSERKKPSVDKDVLAYYAKDYPVVKAIEYTRSLRDMDSKFLSPLLFWNTGGKIYYSVLIHGTETGRPSTSDPNMLNIKRDKELKSLFIAPPGYLILACDYRQLELRVLADFSGDTVMTNIFLEGRDMHYETQRDVLKKPDKDDNEARVAAKGVNFGIPYGISAEGLARDIQLQGVRVTVEECEEYIEGWTKKFKVAYKYLVDNVKFAKEYGYCDTKTGWRRKVEWTGDWRKDGHTEREIFNAPIQGPAANITRLAHFELAKYPKAEVFLEIYDALYFMVKEEDAVEVARHIKRVMEHPKKLPFEMTVPLEVEIQIGKSLGDLKNMEG